jgi:hypothetical protein
LRSRGRGRVLAGVGQVVGTEALRRERGADRVGRRAAERIERIAVRRPVVLVLDLLVLRVLDVFQRAPLLAVDPPDLDGEVRADLVGVAEDVLVLVGQARTIHHGALVEPLEEDRAVRVRDGIVDRVTLRAPRPLKR